MIRFLFSLLFSTSLLLASEVAPFSARPVEGGLSNQNFIEYHNGKEVFVKYKPDSIQVLGTSFEDEVRATQLAQKLGLCPPLLWADPEKKSLAFHFLADARPFAASDEEIKLLCQSLKRLHNHEPMGKFFDPYKQIHQEFELFNDTSSKHTQWITEFSNQLHLLERYKFYFPLDARPCHLDLWTPNIVCTGDPNAPVVWILDWEYAGDCDPDYDLAVFSLLDNMDESLEAQILVAYGKTLDEPYKERMTYIKALACLRIASWYATKSAICDKKTISQEAWDYLDHSKKYLEKMARTFHPPEKP